MTLTGIQDCCGGLGSVRELILGSGSMQPRCVEGWADKKQVPNTACTERYFIDYT